MSYLPLSDRACACRCPIGSYVEWTSVWWGRRGYGLILRVTRGGAFRIAYAAALAYRHDVEGD